MKNKSITNPKLYNEVMREARLKFKRFPSIYASSWIVREYKKRGGKYIGSKNKEKTGLKRWYKEQWIQVIPYLKNGEKIICGSNNKDGKACRPLIRKGKNTPITLEELKKIYSSNKLISLARKKEKDMKGRVSWKRGTFKSSRSGFGKQFLFNPENPELSFDVYIDKRPEDTISIKYKNLEDVKRTILKLEKLYKNKKYPHKRIWQVGMIMQVRLRVLKLKKKKQYKLANRYFKFLGKRSQIKDKNKKIEFQKRKKLTFKMAFKK